MKRNFLDTWLHHHGGSVENETWNLRPQLGGHPHPGGRDTSLGEIILVEKSTLSANCHKCKN